MKVIWRIFFFKISALHARLFFGMKSHRLMCCYFAISNILFWFSPSFTKYSFYFIFSWTKQSCLYLLRVEMYVRVESIRKKNRKSIFAKCKMWGICVVERNFLESNYSHRLRVGNCITWFLLQQFFNSFLYCEVFMRIIGFDVQRLNLLTLVGVINSIICFKVVDFSHFIANKKINSLNFKRVH